MTAIDYNIFINLDEKGAKFRTYKDSKYYRCHQRLLIKYLLLQSKRTTLQIARETVKIISFVVNITERYDF